MGKNIVNVALFGLGRIGQLHAKNLLSHPRFNLIYVYDLNKKLSKKMSNKFKCANLSNPDIAMKDKKVDVIFVATSTSTHLKFITNAVKNKKVVQIFLKNTLIFQVKDNQFPTILMYQLPFVLLEV